MISVGRSVDALAVLRWCSGQPSNVPVPVVRDGRRAEDMCMARVQVMMMRAMMEQEQRMPVVGGQSSVVRHWLWPHVAPESPGSLSIFSAFVQVAPVLLCILERDIPFGPVQRSGGVSTRWLPWFAPGLPQHCSITSGDQAHQGVGCGERRKDAEVICIVCNLAPP